MVAYSKHLTFHCVYLDRLHDSTSVIMCLFAIKYNYFNVNVLMFSSLDIFFSSMRLYAQNNHPNPGKPFKGLQATAYLPDSPEGNRVLELLKKAFSQRLVFTVGVSNNTEGDGHVIWNGISHKTNKYGGHLR